MKVKAIVITDMEIHAQLKIEAAKRGISMIKLTALLLAQGLNNSNKK